ncbi:hypothetical protein HG530_015152 [Fusarium avenaceum]|nr:hypothetical protein HG530_015152 [Fusarium avenaceum]
MAAAASSTKVTPSVSSPQGTTEPASRNRPEEARKLGITQLHPDPGDPVANEAKEVDIFVLHGLDARSDKTFLAWKVDNNPNSGTVNWLSDPDMLPARMSQARILTYDWNANYDKTASEQTMLDHADDLLVKVLMNRRELAVVRSLELQHTRSEGIRQIFDCCIGIVFLGTPFRGSWQEGTEVARKRIEISKQEKPEDGISYSMELVQYLKLSTKDTPSPLDSLIQRFLESINNLKYRIPYASLYETQPTDFASLWSRLHQSNDQDGEQNRGKALTVPKDSAVPYGSDRSGQEVRHNLLHKYNSIDNVTFKSLCLRLEEFVEKADETTRLRNMARSIEIETKNASSLRNKLSRTDDTHAKAVWSNRFKFPKMDRRHLELQQAKVASGTCEWLFQHHEYVTWETQDADDGIRTLFIHGKGGSGKSTVMNAALVRCRDNSKDSDSIQLHCFFYTPESTFPQNSVQGLYRCLISQLLEKMNSSPELLDLVRQWDTREQNAEHMLQDIVLLKDRLSVLFDCVRGQKVQIFIDALDECEKGEEGATDHIRDMLHYMRGQQERIVTLSVLYSIREIATLGSFVSASTIQVTQYNGHDLLNYLNETLGYSKRPLFRAELIQVLLKRSSNVFLWIKLVVQTLNLKENSGLTGEELKQAVERLPKEMEGLYLQFLENLSVERRSEALLLLQLLQVSMRPMNLSEIRSALEYARGTEYEPKEFGISSEAFNDRIRSMCRGFVEIQEEREPYGAFDDEERTENLQIGRDRDRFPQDADRDDSASLPSKLVLQFSHETAREFLNKCSRQGFDDKNSKKTTDLQAHLEVAELCMRAVNQAVNNGGKESAFLPYASRFWTTHARKANNIIDHDFQPARFVTKCGFSDKRRTDITISDRLHDDSNMLMLLAFEGCSSLIVKHGKTCRHKTCLRNDAATKAAFALAVRRGCEKTVQAVKSVALQRSIKLDPTTEPELTGGPCPLQLVCQHNLHGVFKAVFDLDWDTSSSAAGLCFLVALKCANKNVVEHFLNKSNDDAVSLLSRTFVKGYTAGHAAAASGSPLILDMILEKMDENTIDPVEILSKRSNGGYTVLDLARRLKRDSHNTRTEGKDYNAIIERLEYTLTST